MCSRNGPIAHLVNGLGPRRTLRLKTGIVSILLMTAAAHPESAAEALGEQSAAPDAQWKTKLELAGIAAESILGVDPNGLPMLCGNGIKDQARQTAEPGPALPSWARGWETIPCVIRDDGAESFRLEVNVNGPVQGVRMQVPLNLQSESGNRQINLRDDGQGEDRIAQDHVFTSEKIYFKAGASYPIPFYLNDTNSPAGLQHEDLHGLQMIEEDGSTNQFTILPSVGILDRTIKATGITLLNEQVQASPYLINVKTGGRIIQAGMRSIDWRVTELSHAIYEVLPDEFDFLFGISTDHLEQVPFNPINLIAGVNHNVRVNFSGTGHGPFDRSSEFGSSGRLKSFNLLDTGTRGMYCNNVTHELMHQWAAFLDSSLGLSEDGAHYKHRSNIGSIVGGQLWREISPGKYTIICEEGRSGLHRAPLLDRYLMGLVEPQRVPLSRVYNESSPGPLALCEQEFSDIVRTVDIQEIIARSGLRLPGPAHAQRNFALAFVAETRERLFNATEMTYYSILAKHYTRPLDAEEPDPYLARNWVPLTRYFGEGTTWKSSIRAVVQPLLLNIETSGSGPVVLSGVGFPGEIYTVELSFDLSSWKNAGELAAEGNGSFSFSDSEHGTGYRFYRLAWP